MNSESLPNRPACGIFLVNDPATHTGWMRLKNFTTFLFAFLLGSAIPLFAQVRITEFMADNTSALADEDGSFEDWIEVYNSSVTPVNLGGWHLTDEDDDLTKWQFPATNLNAGAYLVVFASNKDRRVPGQNLHTNFKLSESGEYLALVQPDGVTIATEFAAPFPGHFPNVSYGFGARQNTSILMATNAPARVFVPTNGILGFNWTAPGFDDSSWLTGTNGIGYDTGVVDPLESSYSALVLESQPVAYWRLDELNGDTAANEGSSGAVANGIYQGDLTLATPGPRPPQFPGFEPGNNAPQFDGVDDFVAGPAALLSERPSFTMAGWIRPTAAQASRTGLWGQNDAIEFGFINGTTIQLWTPVGSFDATYPFPSGEWHHVAAVGTGQQLELYCDGTLTATAPAPAPSYGSSVFNFHIGGGGIFDDSGNHFVGQIDEVAVWHRALPANEIVGMLQGGAAAPVDFSPFIATDVRGRMHGVNASAYVRLPFTVANPADFGRLVLRIRYDDGFVAYLNGLEVARKNAPAANAWNSAAAGRHSDGLAIQFEQFDITPMMGALTVGANVLAIHGLNIDSTNTDFLAQAELTATTVGSLETQPRYFIVPTPGGPNGTGSADLGPILSATSHSPSRPLDNQDLLVTARVLPSFNAISNVILRYRIMFNPEINLPMNDAGTNGDPVAGDGVWSASIPASASISGQMIRYYITATDTAGALSRWPLFPDPLDTEEYRGTVVGDPAVQSLLPVVETFIGNPGGADSRGGTRCSIFHLGEFYDNVLISLHGQSSAGFTKKSYNLDFNGDHRFKYQNGAARVKDLKLLTNWGDKSRTHNPLAYEMIAQAGSAGHFAFQVRVQRNAQFFSIADMTEDGDDRWLERLERDPRGALYKIYNNLGGASGNEKKTRTFEGIGDLQSLINNLSESLPVSQRVVYACDNLDLPQCVSYFVGIALCSSQDHGHKNFYVYCDSEASREWAIFPWDVDLSWGRNWLDAQGYFTDTLFQDNVLNFYNAAQQGKPANRLYNLIFNHPDFRRMYLRRLRTVMDTVLQPPGTPAAGLKIEARIRQMMDAMDPPAFGTSDADLDYTRWGSWGNNNPMRAEATRIINVHLPGRRDFLFNSPNATVNGERIPSAQPSDTKVLIGSIEFNPASGNQAEEFVQLINTNAFAADISGWRLGDAIRHTFKPGTVIPAGGSLYVSPDVSAFRARATAPRGGQGLYVQGNYKGQLNAWGETLALTDDTGRLVSTNSFTGSPSLAQQYLRITEVMYNPTPLAGNTNDAQNFEYLELKNIGPTTLDLRGVRLTNGVEFAFTGSAVTNLAANQTLLVVKNLAAFTARYGGGLLIAGEFIGSLENQGETIRLEDTAGEKILEFAYDNKWYPVTDGLGFSLVVVNESAPWETWGERASWRPSTAPGGSPGVGDAAAPAIGTILVNELLTHTDLPDVDWIELFNPAAMAVNIRGWFITDDLNTPRKFRIVPDTTIPAGGYKVFTEADFNPTPGVGTSFSFRSAGDEVWLFSGDANTNLTGYLHGFRFGAAQNGVTFGRYVNSIGEEQFPAQIARTQGAANSGPRVGPVVINEVMYHPADGGDEFVELKNITGNTVQLFDPTHSTNRWKLAGINFTFPAGMQIAPNGLLVIAAADPAAFRAKYNVPTSVPVLGPYAGALQNDGETLDLQRPDTPDTNGVPYITVDAVRYSDLPPWPAAADGAGASLQRRLAGAHGNDPTNWFASGITPGLDNSPNQPPTTTLTRPADNSAFTAGAPILIEADAADSDGVILKVEFFADGVKLGGAGGSPYTLVWANAPPGLHSLTVRATDNRFTTSVSSAVTITVVAPTPVIAVPAGSVWRYLDNGSDQGTNWTQLAFNDSGWSSGPGQLGYGDGDEATIVGFGGVATNKFITTYFRRSFVIANAASFVDLTVRVLRDDGAAVYLNGTEVFRDNLPTNGPILFNTRALSAVDDSNFYGTNVNPGLLVNGTNLLAAEVHQSSPGSSDISFDLELAGMLTVIGADRDGDGMPDAWEIANDTDPDVADAGADPDGDGLTNFQEYLAGTSPTNALSLLRIESISLEGGGATARLSFNAVSNRTYTVQWRQSLESGAWQKLADVAASSTNRVHSVTSAASGSNSRYYRLVTPLQP